MSSSIAARSRSLGSPMPPPLPVTTRMTSSVWVVRPETKAKRWSEPSLPMHRDIVRRTLIAAVQRPGRKFRAGVADGQEAVVAADAVVHDDAAAAGELALAARLQIELHAVDQQAVARLVDLGRAIVGLAVEAGEDGAVAVAAARGAPAAELRLDDRVLAAGVGMDAADEGAADRWRNGRTPAAPAYAARGSATSCRKRAARSRSRSRAAPAPWRGTPSPRGSAAGSAGTSPHWPANRDRSAT